MTAILSAPTPAEARAHERSRRAGEHLTELARLAGSITDAANGTAGCRTSAAVAFRMAADEMGRADMVAVLYLAAMELHLLGWAGYPNGTGAGR